MPEELSVTARSLEKRFGDFVAVDRVSFDVRKGEIFGFLGPNGAGKSTTIRMLCGLLAPTSGEATVAGYDLRTETEKIKQHIGYMSQRFSLYEDLTVEENIDFYGGIYRIPPERKRARKEWVIGMAGLSDHRRTKTAFLAGGWKQRLALGCAILHEPPILFLDEPTSGVDPISRRNFWDLIYGLSEKGVTVFVTTHYMDEAEYCDRLGLLYRGGLAAMGTPGELKKDRMKDAVVEIRCERPQDAIAVLGKLPGVRGAALFGNGIHAVVERGEAAVPALREALAANGFPVGR
ncbi:MAG: ABC transporter ATP-binding protein, partial [Deltaproteobacteria bacterium]|nr:ABC transporter ATP-binding protein [Deltaproteobacteria bacterium]